MINSVILLVQNLQNFEQCYLKNKKEMKCLRNKL
jgi:hypothetical protein